MTRVLAVTTLIAGAALALHPAPAEARGCIKGAIVGGIAGHVAGHGALGAVAGCVVGRHEANRRDREQGASQRNRP